MEAGRADGTAFRMYCITKGKLTAVHPGQIVYMTVRTCRDSLQNQGGGRGQVPTPDVGTLLRTSALTKNGSHKRVKKHWGTDKNRKH